MTAGSTVLIVDDVRTNRQVLLELLDQEGYRLVEAGDGPEALARAAESPPDLVLLDVMMPGMDGFEVCRRIRADARLADVPVIMVTALDDQASRLAGLEAGADDFVSKPINRVELRARVRTITRLNRYRRLHEQRAQFQWVVEHAGDGYLLVDASDRVVLANACARTWLGLAPPSEHARPETFLAAAGANFTLQPPELWQGWPAVDAGALESARLLVRAETPRARAFFLQVSIHENRGDRLLRLRDVTERMTMQRDQRSFQTMVSHKLRTPLNGLNASLAMLALPDILPVTEVPKFAAIALDSAKRLTRTVDDVLRFTEVSKLGVGNGFPLAALGEVVKGAADAVGLESFRVTVPEAASGVELAWPAPAVEWALMELLDNARKFHPRQAPTVEVSAQLDGNRLVTLTVSDDGVTLSPDQLARAGQPYYQGERTFTGEAPGMGLGIAAVTSLAWQAGGSCRVRNRSGAPGVAVDIRLPVVS